MATKLKKHTAELMLKKLRSKLDGLYQDQEMSKAPKQNRRMLQKGGTIDDELELESWMMDPESFGESPRFDPFANNIWDLPEETFQEENLNFPNDANRDWTDTALTALGTAPMFYNLAQGMGRADRLRASDYYNPYEDTIRSTMRNRRFNVDPILEANRSAQRVADYNLRNSGMGAGAINASRLSNLSSRMRSDATAYAQKTNIDNQYLGEQARMDSELGSRRAATRLNIRDINDRNRAARRNYLAQGFGDLSRFAQTQQLMRNQEEMNPIYGQILKTYNPYATEYFPFLYE